MYAELFRALGWLHPTELGALHFTFTLLGSQVVAAGKNYLPILGETVVGISHPSHVLTSKGNHNIRPFGLLLQTMLESDGCISRDEMIVGPLSASSDREPNAVSRTADLVISVRADQTAISHALAQTANAQGVQINTLQNYTRWPIAVMRDLGWTTKTRRRYANSRRSFEVHYLTADGRRVAERVARSADLRLNDVAVLPFDEKKAISLHAHYSMLDRAGFDIDQVRFTLEALEPSIRRTLDRLQILREKDIVFSPFQSLSISDIKRIFPSSESVASELTLASTGESSGTGRGSRDHLFVKPKLVEMLPERDYVSTDELRTQLSDLRSKHRSLESATDAFVEQHNSDTQREFYPLVVDLIGVLGIEAEVSRGGVNYERWDACAYLDETSAIPIEIKSPAEEEYLSTKAVRQALENKIVLLARGSLNTTREVSTVIVGFRVPNERGDMSLLIDDIYSAYSVSIGVIDFRTLGLLAIRCATQGLTIDPQQLGSLRGFLRG